MNAPISIFSLGSNCTPSLQINRHLGIKPTSPFDWLVTPFDSIIKILQTDGKLFGTSISTALNGKTAFCENYGVFYHHEFTRRVGTEQVIFDVESIENCRNKLLFKYNRMIEICKISKPIFVRYLSGTDVPTDRLGCTLSLNASDAEQLCQIISSKIHHKNYHIIFIKSENNIYDKIDERSLLNIPNISVDYVTSNCSPLEEAQSWNRIFNRLTSRFY